MPLPGDTFQDAFNQTGEILLTLTEGRKNNLKDVEAKEQILTEQPLSDQRAKILIRGSDYPRPYGSSAGGTQPL